MKLFCLVSLFTISAVLSLSPLCPLPPFENNDDVHLTCKLETGTFSSTKLLNARSETTGVNIVEYNIDRNGYGGDGSRESGIDPFIQLLSNASLVPQPDVVVLIEVARGCSNYGGVDVSGAQEIARKLGFNYAYAVEYVDISQSDEVNECTIGNAILSRYDIANLQQLRFDSQCCRYDGRYGGRISLIGDIMSSSGKALAHLHAGHLESGQSNVAMVLESLVVRERQAQEMAAVEWSDSAPRLIVGDLNSPIPAIDPTIVALRRNGFVNSFENITIQNREKFQLDYLLSSPSVLSAAGWCSAAECEGWSDHVPYYATLVVDGLV